MSMKQKNIKRFFLFLCWLWIAASIFSLLDRVVGNSTDFLHWMMAIVTAFIFSGPLGYVIKINNLVIILLLTLSPIMYWEVPLETSCIKYPLFHINLF